MVTAGIEYLYSKPWALGMSETSVVPITGTVPDVTGAGKLKNTVNLGKTVANTAKTVSKSAKLASQTAKEDKALGIGRKVKNIVKNDKSYATGDARHANSGQSRVKNSLIRLAMELMADNTYVPSYSREYNRLNVKLAKASNPDNINKIKQQLKDLAKKFIEAGYLH